eukprot:TRINITY_DN99_c0_g1_i2.p1 TRINITY_DN99_c0_g1~~TRINITY_DN99_c0_g1_i2.p1  ORF type:complete len:142 (-),score=72.23 TRINITY_DN99_c0_g1_i2:104-529(-)
MCIRDRVSTQSTGSNKGAFLSPGQATMNQSNDVNPALARLQASVRIGGKGSVRRKKKVVHKTTTTDDKRLQNTLKRLGINSIPAIEEVNLFMETGEVIHFTNPKVQASIEANTCLLYTSDAADDLLCVDLGGRRIIKKKKK